nr:solute carrier family 25 member 43-like isoform X3 [Camelus dromedarius]
MRSAGDSAPVRSMRLAGRDGRHDGQPRLPGAGRRGSLSLSLTRAALGHRAGPGRRRRGRARGPWAACSGWRPRAPRLWNGNAVACTAPSPPQRRAADRYRKFVVLFTDDLGHISQWHSIMAGSLAGMVSTIVTYPTDLIKTRLIVQNMLEPSYRGIFHAFSTIYQQEGFLAFYRGVSLTVLELCQCLPGCCCDPDTLLPLRHREEKDAGLPAFLASSGQILIYTIDIFLKSCADINLGPAESNFK